MTPKEGEGPPPTRHGHDAYQAVSALQKAVRRSQPEAAAYWAVELAASGNGAWLWKRLKVISVEDVAATETGLVADLDTLHRWWKDAKGRGDLNLLPVVRAAVALALARKSRLADDLVIVLADKNAERREVPDEALDRHTRAGRRMGRDWTHFWAEGARLVQPDESALTALEADVSERAAAVLKDQDDPTWIPDAPPAQLRIDG
jgi:replication-associated recombination protein RarA